MVPFFNFHPWSQIQLLSFSPLLCSCCSVAMPCSTLCDPMDYSEPGASVLCCLPEFAQIHVHWVGDAIQPSHPLLTCSKLWWCGRINTQMFHSGHRWKTECKLFTFEKKKTESYFTFSTKYCLWSNILRMLWGRREGDRQRQRDSFFNRRLLSPNSPVWHRGFWMI